MAEFYLWTREVTYIVTFMFALCVLSQTLTTMASFYRHPRSRVWACETFLELCVLCHVFVLSLLHGATREAHITNILVPTGYVAARIVIFALIAVLAAAVFLQSRKAWPLLTIAAASLTLPISESLLGNFFAFVYIAAILLWLIRGLHIGFWRYHEIRSGISALSVKHSIDSLNTGVLFCDESGFILLSNNRMQSLMITITGKVQRNGRKFYGLLTLGDIDPGCQIKWYEGQNIIILPDGSAWKISLNDIQAKKKKYTQITATDISEQWKLAAKLQPQNEELMRRQDELSRTMANLHVLSRERETQKAKMLTHDILGERLTMLLRSIRIEQTPDYSALRVLSQGFIDELKEVHGDPVPQDELDILIQTFGSIGVEIIVNGSLPEDAAKGKLFADIAREAITNAVRHGLATRINILMDNSDGVHLRVTDNGHAPDTIKEGGGISGMRKRLEPFGGSLHIVAQPRFILTVDLPG